MSDLSSRTKIYGKQWEEHYGEIINSVKGFDVVQCDKCGFRHVMPLPTSDELSGIYREDYYSKEKPLYLEENAEDLAWWNLAYRDRYDSYEQHLPVGRRRILDVGSGPGFFLLHGRDRGWEVLGIEPSRQSVAHSRKLGLPIIEEFLDDTVAASLKPFDVIHLSQVLEHIPEPKQMLRRINRLLTPGGLVHVVVPNDFNPFQVAVNRACGLRPWWIAPPHHLNFFDFDSLSSLLVQCNFTLLERETSFPIDMFLLMGDNYIDDASLGRICHGKRKQLELNLNAANMNPLKRQLYRAMAELGLGREVQVLASK